MNCEKRTALRRIVTAAWLLLLLPQVATAQAGWRFVHRLQSGMVYDDNVEESLHHPRAAAAMRLLLDTKGFYQSQNRSWSFSWSYQGGGQWYDDVPGENKMMHQARLYAVYHTPLLRIGLRGGVRLKRFFRKRLTWIHTDISPYAVIALGKHVDLEVSSQLQNLDYRYNDIYDCSKYCNAVQIRKQVYSNLNIAVGANINPVYMQRPAFHYDAGDDTWLEKHEQQQDIETVATVRADWYISGFLLNALFRYDRYDSNSDGVRYQRSMMTLMAARQVSDVLFRIIVAFQRKDYLDDVFPYLPLDLDVENEENNVVIIDLSRQLSAGLVLLIRSAWYSNESPYASLYYEKMEISTGLEYRF